jgi:hypothetical protein
MSGRPRYPEKLLDVAELHLLLGDHRNTLVARFKPGGDWHRDGFLIGSSYRLPVSAYNRWLESKRLSMEDMKT